MGKRQKQHEGREKPGGDVRIEDTVVSKLAGLAAMEVEGVYMGGGASRAVGGILEGVTGTGGSQTRGVSVEVGEKEAAVDLTLAVDYGKSVPRITESVHRNIIERVEYLSGFRVAEVNITVNDVIVPDPGEDERRLEGAR